MTHTLHRTADQFCPETSVKDVVIIAMAAKDHNREGASEKLKNVFNIFRKHNPSNLADDNRGGILTGLTCEEILDSATDKAYMGAVFTSYASIKTVLSELKEADIGVSIVVSGEIDPVFSILSEIGLKPHTVNLSLGTFGPTELLDSSEILAITGMCGHGMISRNSVKKKIREIIKGQTTPRAAALELARRCTCGIFNPELAESIFQEVTGKSDENDHS